MVRDVDKLIGSSQFRKSYGVGSTCASTDQLFQRLYLLALCQKPTMLQGLAQQASPKLLAGPLCLQ